MLLSQDSCCKLCSLLGDSVLCNEKVVPLWTFLTFFPYWRTVITEIQNKRQKKIYSSLC